MSDIYGPADVRRIENPLSRVAYPISILGSIIYGYSFEKALLISKLGSASNYVHL